MATPIQFSAFKSIVEQALNDVFDEAYEEYGKTIFPDEDPSEYTKEVDFG